MIYVKEWNNRYNCTAIKKNAFHLTKVTDDVMPKIPKYQQKRWWSQSGRFCITNGHEKVCLCVCWTVHYMFISSVPVKPDG